MNDASYDFEDTKATRKALKEVNMSQNSQIALAIIQSLLASNSGTTFESIVSVH